MSPVKIVGIVLIVLGAVGLAAGGFSFTKETHQAKLGPLQLSVRRRRTSTFPRGSGSRASRWGWCCW